MTLDLDKAEKLAERIRAQLAPFCEQIAIAGSIRRRRMFVNDIDIVALPRPKDLLAFRARVKQATSLVKDGDQNLIVRLQNGFQLDIFIAHPEQRELLDVTPTNYGSLLLCRTGSTEHNIYLVEHAKAIGLRWNPYMGVFDETFKCIASVTEEEIFMALRLEYVPPEKRER